MSKMQPRSLTAIVEQDLRDKMVLFAGPRQCGKTSMAKELIKKLDGMYYSWDDAVDRKTLRTLTLNESAHLWALDEIHKYRGWRNWLKGLYDKHGQQHPVFVTGSARLDLYHRGGDSLAGRYFLHHLHPFTLAVWMVIEIRRNLGRGRLAS